MNVSVDLVNSELESSWLRRNFSVEFETVDNNQVDFSVKKMSWTVVAEKCSITLVDGDRRQEFGE